MDNLLCLVLSLSLSGGILVLFVALLNRLLRGKIPRAFLYCLWLLALARFLLPVGTSWSVTHRLVDAFREPRAQAAPSVGAPAPLPPTRGENPSVDPGEAYAPAAPERDRTPGPVLARPSVTSAPSAASVLTAAWGLGVLACLGWRLYSYHRLDRSLKEGELPVEDWELELYSGLIGERSAGPALRRSETARSPMLAGVLRTAIWLPAGSLDAAELSYALRHELTHWRRHDLTCKWAAALTACLHWFNPAVWYLLRAVDRDCELSCDETVVKEFPLRDRRAYGELLLRCAAGNAPTGALYTSFKTKKNMIKERLTVIMRKCPDGKKARALFAAAAVVVLLTGTVLGAYAAFGGTGADAAPVETETGENTAPVETETGKNTAPAETETGENAAPAETETGENAAPAGTETGWDAAFKTDLNRNGVPETIHVTLRDEEMWYQLTVTEGDKVIFTEDAHFSHAGWDALFLYQRDGQAFLLRYNPEMWQGDAYYSYRLFYLTEDGSEVTVQENGVYFDVNFGMSIHGDFDPAAIDAFLAEVNSLLSDSILLVNTDADLIEAFEREGKLHHVPSFVYWDYDESKTMLENLIAYKSAMEAIYS